MSVFRCWVSLFIANVKVSYLYNNMKQRNESSVRDPHLNQNWISLTEINIFYIFLNISEGEKQNDTTFMIFHCIWTTILKQAIQ